MPPRGEPLGSSEWGDPKVVAAPRLTKRELVDRAGPGGMPIERSAGEQADRDRHAHVDLSRVASLAFDFSLANAGSASFGHQVLRPALVALLPRDARPGCVGQSGRVTLIRRLTGRFGEVPSDVAMACDDQDQRSGRRSVGNARELAAWGSRTSSGAYFDNS